MRYAVKAIQKSRVRDYDTFQNEIKILRTLVNSSLIIIFRTIQTSSSFMRYGNGNRSASSLQSTSILIIYLYSYCEGGELFYYVIQRKSLSEKEAAMIMKQCFSALKYLHHNKISHRYVNQEYIWEWYRDIKPENFLLKNKDNIENVKMIDFGLSKDYSETKIMQTPSGSVIY